MPNYDYKCKVCGNVQEENHSYTKITNDENDISNTIECQKCNLVGEMIRVMGNSGLANFSMMTPEQKKESLKKRSHEHFKKHVEERFHQMNKKTL